jgi:hypothetical protein
MRTISKVIVLVAFATPIAVQPALAGGLLGRFSRHGQHACHGGCHPQPVVNPCPQAPYNPYPVNYYASGNGAECTKHGLLECFAGNAAGLKKAVNKAAAHNALYHWMPSDPYAASVKPCNQAFYPVTDF